MILPFLSILVITLTVSVPLYVLQTETRKKNTDILFIEKVAEKLIHAGWILVINTKFRRSNEYLQHLTNDLFTPKQIRNVFLNIFDAAVCHEKKKINSWVPREDRVSLPFWFHIATKTIIPCEDMVDLRDVYGYLQKMKEDKEREISFDIDTTEREDSIDINIDTVESENLITERDNPSQGVEDEDDAEDFEKI